MKKLNFVLFLFLLNIVINANAQNEKIYASLPSLEQYEGTWRWTSGDSCVYIAFEVSKINLKEEFGDDYPDVYTDVLLGWHEFSVGKIMKQNSIIKKQRSDLKNKGYTIVGYYSTNNVVQLSKFQDLNNLTNCSGTLSLLGSGKIKISITTIPHLKTNLNRVKKEFEIPQDMIMSKIR